MTQEYEWPDTSPVDKSDPYWQANNNLNVNGTSYHKVEVLPGRWQWRVNEELEAYYRGIEQRRRDLFHALRTRALTPEEMREVREYGSHLNIEPNVPYYAAEKSAELSQALMHQVLLQQRAPAGASPSHD